MNNEMRLFMQSHNLWGSIGIWEPFADSPQDLRASGYMRESAHTHTHSAKVYFSAQLHGIVAYWETEREGERERERETESESENRNLGTNNSLIFDSRAGFFFQYAHIWVLECHALAAILSSPEIINGKEYSNLTFKSIWGQITHKIFNERMYENSYFKIWKIHSQ